MSELDPFTAASAEVLPWRLPSVNEGEEDLAVHSEDFDADDLPNLPTAEEIAEWEAEASKKGYDEGYQSGHEKGYAEGLQGGQTEVAEKARYFAGLIASLDEPFKQLDERVEQELRHLIVALAQQLVRREIRIEPGEVIGVIRESMALLPANKRRVSINLHPEDAALLRDTLAASDSDNNWTLVEDPLITRGGCRISTEVSNLDVTLESRLASLAATMLGGVRESDG